MSKQDLKETFRQAMELETAIHCQEEILKDARNMKVTHPVKPQKPRQSPEVEKARKVWLDVHSPDDPAKTLKKPKEPALLGSVIFLVGFGIALFVGMFVGLHWIFFDGVDFGKEFLIVFGIVFGIYLVFQLISHGSEKRAYNAAMKKYNEDFRRLNDQYKKDKAIYETKNKEARENLARAEEKFEADHEKAVEKWEQTCDNMTRNLRLAKEEAERLVRPINEAKKTLEEFYAKSGIYPKYCNLAAVCTIYEYLDSGRCTQLEGPDGAYNLFEAELRQDLIIMKLDEVIENLWKLQKGQYLLYTKLTAVEKEVRQMNSSMRALAESSKAISKDVKNMGESMGRVAKATEYTALASAVTAQCAILTAKNTEAIKYLTLID